MVVANPNTLKTIFSFEEYLKLEDISEIRHEFVNGNLKAMAGETMEHNDIAANVLTTLKPIARAKKCRVQIETVRVQTGPNQYRYPDVFVACAPRGSNPRLEQNPCFILEVLSESTQSEYFGPKVREYTRIPSLQVYVIAAQDKRSVTIYRRQVQGWVIEFLEGNGEIELPCLEARLSLDTIYEGLDLPV